MAKIIDCVRIRPAVGGFTITKSYKETDPKKDSDRWLPDEPEIVKETLDAALDVARECLTGSKEAVEKAAKKGGRGGYTLPGRADATGG